MKKVVKIDGMGCMHCVNSVKTALEALEGVEVLEVKIGEATVEIAEDYDFNKIVEALDDAGYEVI
ncbi:MULTISPECIES: heavy-metal-associated domain-containing protein [unclassified Fusobacterium]|uniref:heavy-metal-associated domain-containing protein n=1 Tax=unclassified Fusobacterium TaxID=2648384 RepID=UPI0025BFF7A2|nr:heavy-metal-associated domain-containing protein [Fusobacterium sp.]